jgi:hypothetical protein
MTIGTLDQGSTDPSRRDAVDWGPLAVAWLTLAGASVSLVLCIAQLALGRARVFFVQHNNAAPGVRTTVLLAVFAAAILPLAACAPAVLRKGRAAAARQIQYARVASPLVVAWAVPALLTPQLAREQPLAYLLLLAAVGLVLERLLRSALLAANVGGGTAARLPQAQQRAEQRGLLAVTAALAVVFAFLAARKALTAYGSFEAGGSELAANTRLLSALLSGQDIAAAELATYSGSVYAAPFFAAAPRGETLLVLQVVALAVAALPLAAFASHQLSARAAAVVVIAYLAFAPLHAAAIADFSLHALAVPLWFSLLAAVVRRRLKLALTIAAALLLFGHDACLLLVGVGFCLVAVTDRTKLGLGLAAAGFAGVVLFSVAGAWSPSRAAFTVSGPLGQPSSASAVELLLTNPTYVWQTLATEQKLTFVAHLLAPLLLLPVRSLAFAPLLAPAALLTLLNGRTDISVASAHTHAWLVPLFGAVVFALRRWARLERPVIARGAALVALPLLITCHTYAFTTANPRAPAPSRLSREPSAPNHLASALAQVPAGASLAVTSGLAPHVASREGLCNVGEAACQAEFAVLDLSALDDRERAALESSLGKRGYAVRNTFGPLQLLQRGHAPEPTPAALRESGVGLPGRPKSRVQPQRPDAAAPRPARVPLRGAATDEIPPSLRRNTPPKPANR